MKKRYIKPSMEVRAALLPGTPLMFASGVHGNNGIDWGGYDDEGDIIPSAKMNIVFHDMWEKDEVSDTNND
jgi:hypothetical protein